MENARRHREAVQREAAVAHGLAAKAAFSELLEKLPADYRGLVSALVQENNELLVRVQQRLRQNHLLLARSLELMQNFLATLIPPVGPATYSPAGNMSPRASLSHPLLEALG
jgi:flagellar biosynthesis/type III secretory pathway chaperone